MPRTFRNPILPGFYPDPSVCRVGGDFYLINSTFEFFPGLPIHHSRDLVHWRPIGHVLTRPSQLNLDGIRPSGGLYAPTIRHHDGTFYVINTLVDGQKEKGNFIVTAPDIAGPWSDPVWLENAPGIDPSLLFDDDGRVWFVGNRHRAKAEYQGHTEIWLQELDRKSLQLTGPQYPLWEGALKKAVWAEGPHIYKINGLYYLLIAEGGTGHNHAVTVARSETVTGPYEGNPRNPILTHRHLGLDYPIVGTGHADLFDTPQGDWWMVMLAMRPYGGYFYNLGRETFLAPVVWEEGWPLVAPGAGRVERESAAPDLPEHPWPAPPACDHFDAPTLGLQWDFLRTPREEFWSLSERPGHLRLKLRPQTLSEWSNPSFVGRRQQHMNFTARAAMEFTPNNSDECAGIVLLQNDNYHFRFVVTREKDPAAVLIKREKGEDAVLAKRPVGGGKLYFKVSAAGQSYNFHVASEYEQWIPVAENVDGRILSTPMAGGFIGAYLGMYASANGKPSSNCADWDWFEYAGVDAGPG
ncbi:MAG: glycoside hydrolase family 43 protein [Anaerolineales bacterium]|nr:glycoside hydrolase family 43 protein [Anaerolineales bacterium]